MARLTENLNLQRGLLQFLDQHPSVQILDKIKVQSILSSGEDGGHWPLVHLDNSRVLRARLLVITRLLIAKTLIVFRLAQMASILPCGLILTYPPLDGPMRHKPLSPLCFILLVFPHSIHRFPTPWHFKDSYPRAQLHSFPCLLQLPLLFGRLSLYWLLL